MSKRVTAPEQFERITYVLARAAREGGARLDELVELLQVSPDQLLRDLHEVTTRTDHHPAGSVDDFTISIDRHSVSVWTTGEFRRPTRLSAREALALGLGLRLLAAESAPARREELLALASRLDSALASTPADELMPHYGIAEGAGGADGILAHLRDAARERQRCRIEYLKPGAPTPEMRVISPYALVYAEGSWYTLAHCQEREAVRAFRLDRIITVHLVGDGFEVPPDFDPRHYLAEGRLYRSEDEIEVTIRYSPSIARWIRERERVTPESDGSIVLRHRVADPRWVVGHVLQYGREAEVLAPPEIRRLVGETLRRMLAMIAANGADFADTIDNATGPTAPRHGGQQTMERRAPNGQAGASTRPESGAVVGYHTEAGA